MALPVSDFPSRRRLAGYGPVLLRLVVGSFLVYGVQDNVFSSARMEEFAKFLAAHEFPWPTFCAYLSAYAQFVCGILIALGAAIRLASVPMIFNFLVAVLCVHLRDGDPFPRHFPALVILAACVLFLLDGAGRLSVDHWLARRTAARRA
jgi:putative oxidoreductase